MEIVDIKISSKYVYYEPGMWIRDLYPMMYGWAIISTDPEILRIFRIFNRQICAKVAFSSDIFAWIARK